MKNFPLRHVYYEISIISMHNTREVDNDSLEDTRILHDQAGAKTKNKNTLFRNTGYIETVTIKKES